MTERSHRHLSVVGSGPPPAPPEVPVVLLLPADVEAAARGIAEDADLDLEEWIGDALLRAVENRRRPA